MHEKGSVHYLEDFLSLSSCCVHVFVVGMDSMFVYDVYCDVHFVVISAGFLYTCSSFIHNNPFFFHPLSLAD